MVDPLFEHQFRSLYAPLQPDGHLPPGLNESTVKAVFRKRDLRHVLAVTGIRHFTGSPEKRLRKALDDPQIRIRLGEHRCGSCRSPLVFYFLLYSYLYDSPHARGVYKRLVQPAEYGDKGQVFLDGGRFARGLEDEKKAIGEVVAPISPRSTEEALAQFALAFALLQPGYPLKAGHLVLSMT